jgi:branched-chain amino acid transport system substrate-binding protein
MLSLAQLRVFLVCALLLVLGAACVQTPQQTAPEPQPAAEEGPAAFKVGVVTSLSGDLALGGNITKRGYEYWADTVNEQGGIELNGEKYPVELVFADAQSDPAQAAEAAERLITEENVDFILGPYSSSATMGAAPIIEKYRAPHITGSAESPSIWKEGFQYTFGTIPAANLMAPASVRTLLASDCEVETAYVVGIDDPFASAVAQAFRDTAEQEGLEVLDYTLVPGDADLSPVISKAKAANPDVFLFGGHPENHIQLMKVSEELDFNPKAFLIHWGVETRDFLDGAEDRAEYVWGTAPWFPSAQYSDPLWGDTAAAVEGFNARHGRSPDYTEAASAATGVVFMEALKQIDTDGPPLDEQEKEALVQALENIDVTTFFGPVSFDDSGEFMHDNTGLTVLTLQIQDGEAVVIGPPDQAKAEPRCPAPAWSER